MRLNLPARARKIQNNEDFTTRDTRTCTEKIDTNQGKRSCRPMGQAAVRPIGIKLSDAEAWPRISEVARRGSSPSEETYFQALTCPVGLEATGQSPNQAGRRREKEFSCGGASPPHLPFQVRPPVEGESDRREPRPCCSVDANRASRRLPLMGRPLSQPTGSCHPEDGHRHRTWAGGRSRSLDTYP